MLTQVRASFMTSRGIIESALQQASQSHPFVSHLRPTQHSAAKFNIYMCG